MVPNFSRPVRDADFEAIGRLLRLVFDREAEADLVRRLREDGCLVDELCMPQGPDMVAYLAICRMASPAGWMALTPLAVHPHWRREGRGKFLIRTAKRLFPSNENRSLIGVGEGQIFQKARFCGIDTREILSPFGAKATWIDPKFTGTRPIRLSFPKSFEILQQRGAISRPVRRAG